MVSGVRQQQVSIKVIKNIYVFKDTLDERPKCSWPFVSAIAVVCECPAPLGRNPTQKVLGATNCFCGTVPLSLCDPLFHFKISPETCSSLRKSMRVSLKKMWSCTLVILSCALIILAEMNMMSSRIWPLRRLQKCANPRPDPLQVSSIKNEVANGFNSIVE